MTDAAPHSPELDDLPEKKPEGPNRRCILCRSVRPKEAMLRFVISPDGVVTPDIAARLPGRGLWLSPAPNVIEKAKKKNVFPRAARMNVTVPSDLAATVDRLLEDRCVHLIGLARKAGDAVVGYEKVKTLLQKERAAFVIEADDAAENARKKLHAAAYGVSVYKALGREALAKAFARDNAVHAAIVPGGLARRLETDLVRLARLRGRFEDESALEQAPKRGGRQAAVPEDRRN